MKSKLNWKSKNNKRKKDHLSKNNFPRKNTRKHSRNPNCSISSGTVGVTKSITLSRHVADSITSVMNRNTDLTWLSALTNDVHVLRARTHNRWNFPDLQQPPELLVYRRWRGQSFQWDMLRSRLLMYPGFFYLFTLNFRNRKSSYVCLTGKTSFYLGVH